MHLIYCLDTSAINRLFDDPECEAIVKSLLAIGSFRVSAYNVLEVAKTPDCRRRTALIDLMKHLAQQKRPLDQPNTILLNYASAHSKCAPSVEVNRDENLEGLWIALNKPDLVDDEAKNEAGKWAKDLDQNFDQVITGDRDAYQKLFSIDSSARPCSIASTFRHFIAKRHECKSLVADIYQHHVGKMLTDEGYQELVREPVWPLYLLGYAFGVHKRSIQSEGFSPKRNAGAVDLGQAVYLTLCDRFVTNDRPQYQALRLLNVLNTKRRTEVILYDTFRTRLFGFS